MRSSGDGVGVDEGERDGEGAVIVVPETVEVETALVASGSGFKRVDATAAVVLGVEVPFLLSVEEVVGGVVAAAKEVCLIFGFSMGAMLGPNCASSSMQRRARRSSGVRLECGFGKVRGGVCECRCRCCLLEPVERVIKIRIRRITQRGVLVVCIHTFYRSWAGLHCK